MPRTRRLAPMAPLALVLAGSFSTLPAAPDLRPQPPAPDFMKRLLREARRETVRASPPLSIQGEIEDLEFEQARARQAERIFRRSARGALGDQLEPLLRSLPFFDRLQKGREFSLTSDRPESTSPGVAGRPEPVASPPGPAASGSLGFRLDAHPRLLLRGRLHQTRGVLELPVLEREIRLSVDHPLGSLGTATLRGGLSHDGDEWLSLSLNLRF